MPVKLVDQDELKSIQRLTPIIQTTEWKEIVEHLNGKNKLQEGKALQVTLSDTTVQLLNKKKLAPEQAKKRALLAFRQKLITTFPQFRVRAVGGELAVINKK